MDVNALLRNEPSWDTSIIKPGNTVRVQINGIGDERGQTFEGMIIRERRGGNGASFTVRRVSYGIGVERTFPIRSPLIEKVSLVRRGKVRRARLYYLRQLSAKKARRKVKIVREG